MNSTRDDLWLQNELKVIWNKYFSDLKMINPIDIRFGRKAKCRLGSIKLTKEKKSLISINSLLKDPRVPDYLITVTIAHELVHYGHGFSSLHKRKFKHPHQGGVVTKELEARGLGKYIESQKSWLKNNWVNYLKDNHPDVLTFKRRRSKNRYVKLWF